MKLCTVIPVRMASQRFPNKPLKNINGKPMLQYVWENANNSKFSNDVFVLTSDSEIKTAVEGFHGKVIMTPENVKSGTERLASVLGQLSEYEFIFNLQGDEPLFRGENIDLLFNEFPKDDDRFVCGTFYFPLNNVSAKDPNNVKVIFNDKGEAIYFSRSPIPYRGPYFKHIGVYLYRRDFVKTYMKLLPLANEVSEKLEQLRIIEHGYKIFITRLPEDTIGVDTENDLKAVEDILNDKEKI